MRKLHCYICDSTRILQEYSAFMDVNNPIFFTGDLDLQPNKVFWCVDCDDNCAPIWKEEDEHPLV